MCLAEVPIEIRKAIGTAERYPTPLKLACDNFKADLGLDTPDQDCHEPADFAIIATIGPKGLCSTLSELEASVRQGETRPHHHSSPV